MYIIFLSGCGTDKCARVVVFAASIRPHLKKRYHTRVKRVRDYLEFVKDFEELISPQSLFLHFLGPKPSNKVRKNIENLRPSRRVSTLTLFFFFLFARNHRLFLFFFRNDDQVQQGETGRGLGEEG